MKTADEILSQMITKHAELAKQEKSLEDILKNTPTALYALQISKDINILKGELKALVWLMGE